MKRINNSGIVKTATLAVAVFSLASCSFDPIDKTYNKHTADDDYRRIREISSIDSADAALLGKYMVEHNLAGNHIMELHTTYKEILEQAKKEKEKYEIEKIKKGKKNEIDFAKSHEIEKIKNLKKVLFVDFVKQEDVSEDALLPISRKTRKPEAPTNPNIITFDVMFKNVSDKDIRAFKGDINFYDIFHSEIKKVTYTSFKEIPVGDSIVQKFTINLAEASKENATYNDLKKENIKVEWLPDRLIHTDDTVIE